MIARRVQGPSNGAGGLRALLALCCAVLVAACDIASVSEAPAPAARPDGLERTRPEPSQTSRALSDYYERIQQNYVAQGLLRVDGGGPDTPVSRRQLVENFVRIALFEEFSSVGGRMVRSETATQLHRWNQPIRMKLIFGQTVPDRVRARDSQIVRSYAARLSRLTGLPITLSDTAPNFFVFIVNEDDRKQIGPLLREVSPDVDGAAINTVLNMPRSTLCLVFAIDGQQNGIYSRAAAVIRAEHPDLLRQSCIHEELAQGLGLPNDSPLARPSVFNDDEEFGLLTTHDEHLLRMLYDRRMRPGMTAAQARPVAEVIAAELLGGES